MRFAIRSLVKLYETQFLIVIQLLINCVDPIW